MSKPLWMDDLEAEVRGALALCDYTPPEGGHRGPWLVEAMGVIGEQLAEEQLQREMDAALILRMQADMKGMMEKLGIAAIGPTDEPVGL